MLTVIIGMPGTGKTFLTTCIAIACPTVPIYSNYKLNIPNYHELSLYDLVDDKLTNCLILMDEMYNYIESRCSGKILNKVLSYVLFQNRKLHISIYGTVQLKNTIDLRYRNMIDYIIQAQQNQNSYKYFILERISLKTKMIEIAKNDASGLYKYYDTYQIIKNPYQSEFHKIMDSNEKLKYANTIIQDMEKVNIAKNKRDIRLYCLEHNINDEIRKVILLKLGLKKD